MPSRRFGVALALAIVAAAIAAGTGWRVTEVDSSVRLPVCPYLTPEGRCGGDEVTLGTRRPIAVIGAVTGSVFVVVFAAAFVVTGRKRRAPTARAVSR